MDFKQFLVTNVPNAKNEEKLYSISKVLNYLKLPKDFRNDQYYSTYHENTHIIILKVGEKAICYFTLQGINKIFRDHYDDIEVAKPEYEVLTINDKILTIDTITINYKLDNHGRVCFTDLSMPDLINKLKKRNTIAKYSLKFNNDEEKYVLFYKQNIFIYYELLPYADCSFEEKTTIMAIYNVLRV